MKNKPNIAKIIASIKKEKASVKSAPTSASASPSKPAFAFNKDKAQRPIIHGDVRVRDMGKESIDMGAHGASEYFMGGTA